MTDHAADTEALLPSKIGAAIDSVRRRLNRYVLVDGLLCGLAGGVALGAPAALVLSLSAAPVGYAAIAFAVGLVSALGYELRRRWRDPLDAALELDALMDAKDRFSTALQFSREPDPPKLHRLQIR